MTNRRSFIKQGGKAAAGLAFYGAAGQFTRAQGPGNRMRIAVMGLGRGLDLVRAGLDISNTEILYLCDVDQDRIARAQKIVAEKQKTPAAPERDLRRILDDRNVDAVFIAAPNHWHGPATIMACNAGKHVYVEKPACHSPWEGDMMVKAARKNPRLKVQMGNQRRSWPGMIEAIQKLRSGAIGQLRYARCWYTNSRGAIGRGQTVPVPPNLDFALWQGPAPDRPYKDNLVHYNWHWQWHWGNGELGNNGIHALDVARWGLGVNYPTRVNCEGNRYHFYDDQETPDTGVAAFDFGKAGITWDWSSCLPRTNEKLPFVSFYGEGGTMELHGGGYHVYDVKGKLLEQHDAPGGDKIHIENFFETIRSRHAKLNSEIEEGVISTHLCHLGNIAYRTSQTLTVDPTTGQVGKNAAVAKLWKREYRKGWEPKV